MRHQLALIGNPNSGKTSLFNALTGSNQYVGNWPGVTVEKKSGKLKGDNTRIIQDLPGIYSLSPYSPEEIITRDYALSHQEEPFINILDATSLERGLYLTTQLLELNVPLTIVLNMMDLIDKQGKKIKTKKMSELLNAPVFCLSLAKQQGLEPLKAHLSTDITPMPFNLLTYDKRLEAALAEISLFLKGLVPENKQRWYSIKLFEKDALILEQLNLPHNSLKEIDDIIAITEKIFGSDHESILINERYQLVDYLIAQCVTTQDQTTESLTDKVDNILTNKWLGLPIFAFIMWLVYYLSIQTVGAFGTDWLNDVLFGQWLPEHLETLLQSWQVADWLQSLILEGILAGVGAVLGFVPQLIVLFICLSILEDSGYMMRIAFILDKLFRRFGLSGKSFIPMLVATGCGVPGVMACRTIENEKERRMTIITTTFMPCSAKLPIIGLIASAFFPKNSLIAPSAYFIGMGAIILSGLALKKTKAFNNEQLPFLMELPHYHLPQLKNILRQTFDRALAFIKNAGSVIFVSAMIIWFLSHYNTRLEMVTTNESLLATLGHYIAIIFQPLGWGNWQMTVATIMGLVAKENVVGTIGVLTSGTEVVTNGALAELITPLAGFSFLVFNLLCAPCFAAMGAIKREMNHRNWTFFAIGYQCLLAYVISFVIYQLGSLFTAEQHFGLGSLLAIIFVIATLLWLMYQPKKREVCQTASQFSTERK